MLTPAEKALHCRDSRSCCCCRCCYVGPLTTITDRPTIASTASLATISHCPRRSSRRSSTVPSLAKPHRLACRDLPRTKTEALDQEHTFADMGKLSSCKGVEAGSAPIHGRSLYACTLPHNVVGYGRASQVSCVSCVHGWIGRPTRL